MLMVDGDSLIHTLSMNDHVEREEKQRGQTSSHSCRGGGIVSIPEAATTVASASLRLCFTMLNTDAHVCPSPLCRLVPKFACDLRKLASTVERENTVSCCVDSGSLDDHS